MATKHAKDLPTGTRNYIKNVAIIGAGGTMGKHLAEHLLATDKHKVTAITRPESKNTLPSGLHAVTKVDYDDHASLVSAMRGQDVLIITMNARVPRESQRRLIKAAVDAKVPWIMPNEWGALHHRHPQVAKDTMIGEMPNATRKYIKDVGGETTHAIGITCGFWYHYSVAGHKDRYGFDFDKKELTLYDNGEARLSTSSWSKVGRAAAKLLSLKVYPEGENDKGPYLSMWQDDSALIASFTLNQRELFESVLRVTGDSMQDWKIKHDNVRERYERGKEMMQRGETLGFTVSLYARMFYPDEPGNFARETDNDILGLPQEDLDEETKKAVEMAKAVYPTT